MPEKIDGKFFSIILATFNSGRKVESTLQSILSQKEELFELIVVDGASTDDETLDCIIKYESRLTLISEKDEGVYDAFNKGINRAIGKYFYFIGAGDCLRPGILEKVKEFLPPEKPALVYGSCYLTKRKTVYQGREFGKLNFITENICHQAVFYERTVFNIIGKYDARYKVFADWVFNLKCFAHPKIVKNYIPLIISDFEEEGLSAELGNDPAFKKDYPLLVRKHLGVSAYLKCRAFLTNPEVFSACYKASCQFKVRLISLLRPCVHGYRHLKKVIKNKI